MPAAKRAFYNRKGRSVVRKTGTQVRDSPFVLTDSDMAMHIGIALITELGATRRATKTVMRWTGVSDRTARKWLHGQASPSGIHLLALAANSPAVMSLVLKLTGHGDLELGLELRAVEKGLERALSRVRSTLDQKSDREDICLIDEP